MKPRILCTTAIEETWPADEPVLFLGEWCRRHSRREAWSKLDHEVLPYHWDDRDQLFADYRYLAGFHERLLPGIARELNRIQAVNHSLRYWRIVIGPWLGAFIQILFDRWTCVQRALYRYPLRDTVVRALPDTAMIPNDSDEFARFYVDDEWNHQLCAMILRGFTDLPCREIPATASQTRPMMSLRALTRFKTALARGYSSAMGLLTRDDHAFLLNTYLPAVSEAALNRRLNGIPQLWLPGVVPRVARDGELRRWQPGEAAGNAFEACAQALIPRQMPAVYLEGFAELSRTAGSQPWPKRPRVIWTSNQHRTDDVFKVWAAEKVERGTPLVIGQHGGHYGTGKWCFAEDHDIEISDRYLSWGWTSENEKVVPVGEFIGMQGRPADGRTRDEALLVTCSLPRYSYWMYSAFIAGQWLEYFEDQCRFVAALPGAVRDALRIRLYPADFGWDQRNRWRERFPVCRLDDGGLPMRKLVDRARVYISTYNATTFLETLSADIPTVIFWNERHWELRDSARAHFERLRSAGVFHASPESAAAHLAGIWDDVEAWWRDRFVRQALEEFKASYCARPSDMADRLESTLREMIGQ